MTFAPRPALQAAPDRPAGPNRVFVAAFFAGIGWLTRMEVRHVETRWQIVGFWMLAGIYEALFAWGRGGRARSWGFALNGVAATITVALAKAVSENFL